MTEWLPLFMFLTTCLLLMAGFPVAFTLASVSLAFAGIGYSLSSFDPIFLNVLPDRMFGVMQNETLMAVPLFIFMGTLLEKSELAKELLHTLGQLFSRFSAGLGVSVVIVGALLAASTGIVGATVVTLGLISLPSMIQKGYQPSLASGLVCATGTLGQIIPPSIALVLLGDVLSNAYQESLRATGNFSGATVSVGDLFVGALLPGLLLVVLYIVYVNVAHHRHRRSCNNTIAPPLASDRTAFPMATIFTVLIPPLSLIILVLGSIIAGIATPTEAASLGAAGALVLAAVKGKMSLNTLMDSLRQSALINAMVFMILIGACIYSVVFRGLEGDEFVQSMLTNLPGGPMTALIIVMLAIFLLGFILDFIEITFVVIPIVAPALFIQGIDPIWFGVLVALNLQTSFLTPPFGFALFYLRGVADHSINTQTLYKGVIPFIVIQLVVIAAVAIMPNIATWLPSIIF